MVEIRCPSCQTLQGYRYPALTQQPTTNTLPGFHWVCYRCGFEWVE